MEITLEKIELVKDRTGVSYKEAKEALEAADGSVVDAIINIEESVDFGGDDAARSFSDNELFDRIKETASKGNMSRIIVRRGDKILLNLPLTAGILGAVVAPWGVIFGIIAAAGFSCKVEFVNDKGEITDINGKVRTSYSSAREAGQKVYGRGQETFDRFKDSDLYADIKEKSGDAVDRIRESDLYADLKEKGEDALGRIKDGDFYQDLKEKGGDAFDRIKDGSFYQDLKEKTQESFDKDKVKENLEEIRSKAQELFRKKAGQEDEADEAETVSVEIGEVDAEAAEDYSEIELTFGNDEEPAIKEGSDVSDIANAFSEALTDLSSKEHADPAEILEDAVSQIEDAPKAEIDDLYIQEAVEQPAEEILEAVHEQAGDLAEELKTIADAGDSAVDELARILDEVEKESGLKDIEE